MARTCNLKEQFTPIKKIFDHTYIISWDYKEAADSEYATWMFERFDEKPTLEQIKDLILEYYNKEVDNKILYGFSWNDMPVWLSSENQFNYKAAYDLAVQTQGQSLPVTFKFGSKDEPIYHTFTDMEEFTQFYVSAINFINRTLEEGWVKKDNINWSNYSNIPE